jgi:NAD(P)-dependent dehydrogenase (short-subunit alcohol dehydrogenase family)
MTKVIALVGLVSIEKIQVALELAQHYSQAGHTVSIIDNVARLAIDRAQVGDESLQRINGDIIPLLGDVIPRQDADTLILAISENAGLDALFVALDILTEQHPTLDLMTVGLIDLRTCDCFPHLREKLEDYTDVHFLALFNVTHIVGAIEGTVG